MVRPEASLPRSPKRVSRTGWSPGGAQTRASCALRYSTQGPYFYGRSN